MLHGTEPARIFEEQAEEERSLLVEQFRLARRAVFGKSGKPSALAAYENRPVDFTREILGQRTWPGSRAIMEDLVTHRQVCVEACRKSTKSHTAAQLVLGMTVPTPTQTITTAAVWTQVRELIWARVIEMHAKARRRLPGECHTTSLRLGPNWGAIGLSTDKPGRIMGFHSGLEIPAEDADDPMAFDAASVIGIVEKVSHGGRLFIVVDEAPEVRAPILEALYGSMIGDRVYALWQGNPTYDPDSAHPFARAMRSGSGWRRIHIAGEEFDPALEPDPADRCFHGVPKPAQPQSWRDQRAHDWGGKESPLYRVHVLGLPSNLELSRQFIPHALLLLQDQRASCWTDRKDAAVRHIGWDVGASEEGDPNVAQLWIGGRLADRREWRNPDLFRSCEFVRELMVEWGAGGELIPGRNVHIDTTGVGKGTIGIFASWGITIDAVDFGAAARGEWPELCREMNFQNRKSELCWVLRRAFQEGRAHAPAAFSDLWQQAKWHTWKEVPHAAGTAIAVAEKKDELKKRFGRSPDDFDAALIAWSRAPAGPSFRVL